MLLLSFFFVLRKKTGLVRKDFLDSMIELRNRGIRDVQSERLSAINPKNELNFGKFNIVTRTTKHC
jgi:hypothetical protein